MRKKKESPHERTLDDEIPELIPYLSSDMDVLDVGCGLGTITLNVGFQVGDSHQLEFPDDAFDLVYSHTVLHFCLDPARSLQGQKRVAKKGGWVIASGVRDMPTTYPYSPNWEKAYEAGRRLFESRLEKYRASGQDPVTYFIEQNAKAPSYIFYYDFQAARKCMHWFHQAGLTNVQIVVQPRRVKYQGNKHMHPWGGDFLALERRDDLPEQQKQQNREMEERLDGCRNRKDTLVTQAFFE